MPQQIHSSKTPSSKSYLHHLLNTDLQCTLTIILCLTLAAFCINLLHVPTIPIISSIALLNILLLVLMYILLAKSSLNIPNLGITFIISFCGIMVFNLSHNMAFLGLSFTLIIAPLSLWLTQSYIHCFISLFTQLINIILLFRLHLEDAMKYMPFERIVEKISLSITLASFGVILVFGYAFHDKMNLKAISNSPLGYKRSDNQLDSMFHQTRLLRSFNMQAKSLMETLFGSLNILVSHIEPGLGQKLANIAFVSTENLQRLIDNIIDINSDKLTANKSESIPTCIADLFYNTWNSMLLLIHKKGLEGNLVIDNTLPEMVGVDHNRLKQIIVNLVDYFIHTTTKGSISLMVEKIEVTPRVDYTDILCATLDEAENSPENVSYHADEEEHVGFSCSKASAILRKLRPKKQVERMLKITIRNGVLKDKVESVFQKRDEDFQSPIDDMARLSLHVSKKLCERLGGKMTMYTKDKFEQAYIVCIPFEVLQEGKIGRKKLI